MKAGSKPISPARAQKQDIPITPDTRTLPLHDAIAERAYSLWKKYGEPEGRSHEFWLEAENQLLGADNRVNQQATGAVSAHNLSDVVAPAADAKNL